MENPEIQHATTPPHHHTTTPPHHHCHTQTQTDTHTHNTNTITYRHTHVHGRQAAQISSLLLRQHPFVSCCNMQFIDVRRRPYRVEYPGSLLTSEVMQLRARLVLGWGTAWEDLRVLTAFLIFLVEECVCVCMCGLYRCEQVSAVCGLGFPQRHCAEPWRHSKNNTCPWGVSASISGRTSCCEASEPLTFFSNI